MSSHSPIQMTPKICFRGSQPGALLPSRIPLAVSKDIFIVTAVGVAGFWWVYVGDAAKYLIMLRPAFRLRNYPSQGVSNDTIVKP